MLLDHIFVVIFKFRWIEYLIKIFPCFCFSKETSPALSSSKIVSLWVSINPCDALSKSISCYERNRCSIIFHLHWRQLPLLDLDLFLIVRILPKIYSALLLNFHVILVLWYFEKFKWNEKSKCTRQSQNIWDMFKLFGIKPKYDETKTNCKGHTVLRTWIVTDVTRILNTLFRFINYLADFSIYISVWLI